MAVLADKKTVGAPFSNAGELHRVAYDFAVDGGAIADFDVLVADGSMVVGFLYMDVKTAVTSAGLLVADLGKGAGGIEFKSDVAKATLVLDAIIGPDAGEVRYVELADTEKIVFGIEAAAATAGKIEFVFMVYKR